MATNGEFAESCRALYHHMAGWVRAVLATMLTFHNLYLQLAITSSQFSLNMVQAMQREGLFRAQKQLGFVSPYDGKCAAALCKLAISSHYYILVITSL